jgi:hypothetical protein
MLARLTIFQPDRPSRQILLHQTRNYIIGRDDSCSIYIDDDRLSRRHAKLEHMADSWRLSDLSSKNGTLIGGRAISECSLCDTQWIEFGAVLARYDCVSPESIEADRRLFAERWSTSIGMSRDLQPSMGSDELLRRVLESFVELSESGRGFIILKEAAGEFRASVSHPAVGADFGGSRSVVTKSFAENRSVVCSDVRRDPLLSAQASIVGGGISALASLPLRVGAQVIGVIYVDSRQPGKQFSELDVEILQALADHAALVLGVARLRENIVDLSSMLPAELDPTRRPVKALVDELQRYLPQLERGALPEKPAVAAAGEPG